MRKNQGKVMLIEMSHFNLFHYYS